VYRFGLFGGTCGGCLPFVAVCCIFAIFALLCEAACCQRTGLTTFWGTWVYNIPEYFGFEFRRTSRRNKDCLQSFNDLAVQSNRCRLSRWGQDSLYVHPCALLTKSAQSVARPKTEGETESPGATPAMCAAAFANLAAPRSEGCPLISTESSRPLRDASANSAKIKNVK
jgi:hypothetical protein